ncbi:hypothetical protein FQN60_016229 [Etheostoma spectabile]|uniref:Hyaluronan/mRNA-binding protein domain-containing protein n=1 Tax=Etheostoma spectabile TaxID=54343 RepID=A0A5J5D0C7_9PERO|nr:hypothetical protein FQN60_016229 [Etheostoma spectabile]
MPGHLQEGFGCVVTNRFDQLFDDESDPFEILKAAENKKKEGAAAGSTKSAAQAAKQPKKESQKDRKNPLLDKKEESQAPVPLKKEAPLTLADAGLSETQREVNLTDGGKLDNKRCLYRVSGVWAEDQTSRASLVPSIRVGRVKGDLETRGQNGDHLASAVSRSRQRTSQREVESSLQTSLLETGPREGVVADGVGVVEEDGAWAVQKALTPVGNETLTDTAAMTNRDNQKSEEKRSGSSSHNWGNVKDEASEAEQTAAPETTPEGEENAPAGSENKSVSHFLENEVEEVKNEGPKEMTLDEWKAMQDKERTKVEFNIRKPNEGADSQWKKGYVLHKSKSEDRPVGAVIEAAETETEPTPVYNKVPAALTLQQGTPDDSSDHHFRKPANDITSQLEINFGDLGRPGRGRGGARGGRGGRGGGSSGGGSGGVGSRTARGGGRTEKASGVSVPNVDDPEAFPALA